MAMYPIIFLNLLYYTRVATQYTDLQQKAQQFGAIINAPLASPA